MTLVGHGRRWARHAADLTKHVQWFSTQNQTHISYRSCPSYILSPWQSSSSILHLYSQSRSRLQVSIVKDTADIATQSSHPIFIKVEDEQQKSHISNFEAEVISNLHSIFDAKVKDDCANYLYSTLEAKAKDDCVKSLEIMHVIFFRN